MLQPAVDSDQHSVSTEAMQPQNKERAYRQKLLAYQEAQQRQVQLVQKLQTKVARNGSHSLDTSTRMPWSFLTIRLAFVLYKVIQYKKRCGELEEQVLEKTSETEKMRLLVCFYDSIRISTASVQIKNLSFISLLESSRGSFAPYTQLTVKLMMHV